MSYLNTTIGNVVVTRPITKQQPTPTYYEDEVLTSIYYIPRIPSFNLRDLPNSTWILGVIEFVVISTTLLAAILTIILFKKSKSQYKCPNCGKSFCFENTPPQNCKKCGYQLRKLS